MTWKAVVEYNKDLDRYDLRVFDKDSNRHLSSEMLIQETLLGTVPPVFMSVMTANKGVLDALANMVTLEQVERPWGLADKFKKGGPVIPPYTKPRPWREDPYKVTWHSEGTEDRRMK